MTDGIRQLYTSHPLEYSSFCQGIKIDMSAASVEASTTPFTGVRPGSNPRAALQSLRVIPVPVRIDKEVIVANHYLHSLPGGTQLAFGVFLGHRLLGALTLGVGPFNGYRLVEGAAPADCLTLSRFRLSEELPKNSESRVLGVVLRSLRKHTNVKFLLSYADPAQGHLGTIYQATGWVYTGLSQAVPLYDLGDGKIRHSRSLAHGFGTHSVRHFKAKGISIKVIPQSPKHRYLYFLDPKWRGKLKAPVLPYPKRQAGS